MKIIMKMSYFNGNFFMELKGLGEKNREPISGIEKS